MTSWEITPGDAPSDHSPIHGTADAVAWVYQDVMVRLDGLKPMKSRPGKIRPLSPGSDLFGLVVVALEIEHDLIVIFHPERRPF
jgi:hypothetical protein